MEFDSNEFNLDEFDKMIMRYVKNYGDGSGDWEIIKYKNKRWTRPYDPLKPLPQGYHPSYKPGDPPLPTSCTGWQMGVTAEQKLDYLKDFIRKS